MYPKVYDYRKSVFEYGDISHIPSDIYFHGMKEGEARDVKFMMVKDTHYHPKRDRGKWKKMGKGDLITEINDNHRSVRIKDNDAQSLSLEVFDTTDMQMRMTLMR